MTTYLLVGTALLAAALVAIAWLGMQRSAARRNAQAAASEGESLRAALRAREERLRLLIHTLPVGVVLYGRQAEVLDCNGAAVSLLGLPREELLGKSCHDPIWDLVREDGSPVKGADQPAVLALKTQQAIADRVLGVRPRGKLERTWLLCRAEPLRDEEGAVEQVLCTLTDISARKRLEAEIEEHNIRDPLTGCFNRRYVSHFENQAAGAQAQWGCVRLELTGLKQLNEEHGHQVGDGALLRTARLLTLAVRSGEAVVRLGGDEFAVLLAAADEAAVRAVRARIREQAIRLAPVACQLGDAIRDGDESLEDTLRRAANDVELVEVLDPFPTKRMRRL